MKQEKTTGVAKNRDGEAKKPLQKFYIPDLDRTIEAESIEAAIKIAEAEKLNNNNNK